MDLTGLFLKKAESNTRADENRQRDLDDLNHERSGVETGRNNRFMNGGTRGAAADKKKAEEATLRRTLEWLLANDAEYARLHKEADTALIEAETEADSAIEEAHQALADAKEALQNTLDNAAQLPDGTKVFKDANGIVRTQDGKRVDDDIAAGIQWRGSEPSFEQYEADQSRIEDAKNYLQQWTRYRTDVLGDARNKLYDDKNPLSKDELNQLKRDIDTLAPTLKTTEKEAATSDKIVSLKVEQPAV